MVFNYRIWNGKDMIEVESLNMKTKTIYVRSKMGQLVPYSSEKVKLMSGSGVYDDTPHPARKEIFMSDVVQVTNVLDKTVPAYLAVVEWDKYRFALRTIGDVQSRLIFPYTNLDPFGLNLIVVGDVYRTPHLLGN
jgi:hypothetical protein